VLFFIYKELWTEITVPVGLYAYQTIGHVHVPAEPIHTAGRVYRHFDNLFTGDRTLPVICYSCLISDYHVKHIHGLSFDSKHPQNLLQVISFGLGLEPIYLREGTISSK